MIRIFPPNALTAFWKVKKILRIFIRSPIIKITYHIRFKYYQCCNWTRSFRLGSNEAERQHLINSIEKLKGNNEDR